MVGPRPRRAMGPPEAARVKKGDPDRFAAHRLRRGLIAFGTSIALVLGVLGVFGTASASAAPRTSLAVSLNADRSKAKRLDSLDGARQDLCLRAQQPGLKKVTFYLDDSTTVRITRPNRVRAALRLRGTASDGSAYPFDTAKLADGPHTITAVLKWSYGANSVRRAAFTVDNDGATTPPTSTTSPSASATKPPTDEPTGLPTTTATPTRTPTAPRRHGYADGPPDPYADSYPSTATATPTRTPTAPPRTARPRVRRPTPTATATPTATTPPAGNVCTNPVWRSSSNGAMYSDGDFIVHNNMWNTSGYRVSETVEVCSYRSWNVDRHR